MVIPDHRVSPLASYCRLDREIDMRDFGAVLEHWEPLPHRSEDQEQ
jgi:hypothetical protein